MSVYLVVARHSSPGSYLVTSLTVDAPILPTCNVGA